MICGFAIAIIFFVYQGAVSSISAPSAENADLSLRSEQFNKNPEILFPANRDSNPQNLVAINQHLDYQHLIEENAIVNEASLMTFKEYCARLSWSDEYPQLRMDPDRLVWMVEIYYPQFFHPRLGTMKDVTVVSLYDAETGTFFGSSYKGDLGSYSLPRTRFGEELNTDIVR